VTPILPGATIGLLGGGQLGRMTGMAARAMGYDVRVLDPDPDCPARALASVCITARFDDAGAAAELARQSDVVTLEIEQIGPAALEAVARHAPLRPGASAVRVVQDRIHQKEWLARHGFPVGPFRVCASEADCVAAVASLGACVAKSPTGGYDGRGQLRVSASGEAAGAWQALGGRPCVVEQFLDIDAELSVMVARQPADAGGATAVFPPAVNHHEHGVLDWSVLPGHLPPAIDQHARQIALAIAESLGVEGLLAVELFLLRDGRLLVNELAPRPHNTFHSTERGCVTSQFEQLVRAVCGLPLGDVSVVTPAAIANLLGDLWADGAVPDFGAALALPGIRLHLYGKTTARPGRKMGHLSATAANVDDARRLVLEARSRLARPVTV
jgi:5-(carboxyamino)imidazole ribonucleotide synthase